MREELLQAIFQKKLIAIVRGVAPEQMEGVMRALLAGGICMAEITYDHKTEEARRQTPAVIARMRELFGEELCLGAGTVLSVQDVEDAYHAGASYIISPDTNEAVIARTRELGMLSMPGALTPTEIVRAHEAGADIVKLFPAGVFGTEYIKAVRGPLGYIPMAAVGGVTPESIPAFASAGISCYGIGSNLVSAKKAAAGDFLAITEAARAFVAAVRA